MTSTYNDVRAVIEGRIATEMANSPAYEVAFPNAAFTPPTDAPWLSVDIQFGDNTYVTLLAPTTGLTKSPVRCLDGKYLRGCRHWCGCCLHDW